MVHVQHISFTHANEALQNVPAEGPTKGHEPLVCSQPCPGHHV